MSSDRLLSSTDVALLLGMQPSAISNMRKRGAGARNLPDPAYEVGGRAAWTAEQIAPLAEQRRAQLAARLEAMRGAANVLLPTPLDNGGAEEYRPSS